MIVLIAQGRGYIGFNRCRGDRLGHALVDEIKQSADVSGQQHVSRGACALGHNAVDKPLFDEKHLGVDPGFSGEGGEYRLDQIGLTG